MQLGGESRIPAGRLRISARCNVIAWRGRLELSYVHFYIAIHIGGDFRSLRNGNVFTMHEKKERGSWKKQNTGRDHSPDHRAGVAASVSIFHSPQRRLVSVYELDVINIDV